MAKRSRRLKKSLESLEKQIIKHREKLNTTREKRMLTLADYYEREIKDFGREILKKKKHLNPNFVRFA